VLSREQLLERVWGHDFYGEDRVVDVHLGHVRKKIEADPANPEIIVTVRGVGYRFEMRQNKKNRNKYKKPEKFGPLISLNFLILIALELHE
jgi:DNA-binding winged helix-turn-helix (wHTH) protein